MHLKAQKRIAADLMKTSRKKVKLDPTRFEDIKEAITKQDLKGLIKEGAIQKKKTKESSKGRSRKRKEQKRKGQRKGKGSKKGSPSSRLPKKERWMLKIRTQRALLKELKEKKQITSKIFGELYSKAKGGYFRSKRHIMLYLEEHNLVKK